jgi:hypothetical protein
MELHEIFKPKSEEQIESDLKHLSPDQKILAYAILGSLDGVEKAIAEGADIDCAHEDDPSTPLDLALQEGHYDLALHLLEKGSPVGNYALSNAKDREDIFIRLVEKLEPEMCDHESLGLAFDELRECEKYHLVEILEEKIREACDNSKME